MSLKRFVDFLFIFHIVDNFIYKWFVDILVGGLYGWML